MKLKVKVFFIIAILLDPISLYAKRSDLEERQDYYAGLARTRLDKIGKGKIFANYLKMKDKLYKSEDPQEIKETYEQLVKNRQKLLLAKYEDKFLPRFLKLAGPRSLLVDMNKLRTYAADKFELYKSEAEDEEDLTSTVLDQKDGNQAKIAVLKQAISDLEQNIELNCACLQNGGTGGGVPGVPTATGGSGSGTSTNGGSGASSSGQ